MITLSDDEFAALFRPYSEVPKTAAGMPTCPYCHQPLSPESLDYYNGATEYGTPFCDIEIACTSCHRTIWRGGSWYPGIEAADELASVAAEVLRDEITDREGA